MYACGHFIGGGVTMKLNGLATEFCGTSQNYNLLLAKFSLDGIAQWGLTPTGSSTFNTKCNDIDFDARGTTLYLVGYIAGNVEITFGSSGGTNPNCNKVTGTSTSLSRTAILLFVNLEESISSAEVT